MKAVISLTVHEKVPVVLDTLANFRRFFPEAEVVIHANPVWATRNRGIFTESLAPLKHMSGVHLNPDRQRVGWGNILHAHLSNFRHAEKTLCDFDFFVLNASNDLYVRSGVAEYIAGFEAGVRTPTVEPTWDMGIAARNDPPFQALLGELDDPPVRSGQHEGAFFRRELFARIADVVGRHYDVDAAFGPPLIAREEIWISTVTAALATGPLGLPFVYSDAHQGNAKVSEETIRHIRAGDLDLERTTTRQEPEGERVYAIRDPERYYAVKRIARTVDDPLRRFIAGLPA